MFFFKTAATKTPEIEINEINNMQHCKMKTYHTVRLPKKKKKPGRCYNFQHIYITYQIIKHQEIKKVSLSGIIFF